MSMIVKEFTGQIEQVVSLVWNCQLIQWKHEIDVYFIQLYMFYIAFK